MQNFQLKHPNRTFVLAGDMPLKDHKTIRKHRRQHFLKCCLNNIKDQSEFQANTCNGAKGGRTRASEARLVLVWFLIG